MKAGDVAGAAVCIGKSDTLARARNLMVRHKARKLVVLEEGKPIGILSAKDILSSLKAGPLWRRRPMDNILVGTVMSANPRVIREETELSEVARLMLENGISSLPMVGGDGMLSGLVTKEGVLRAFAGAKRNKRVSDLMAKNVFSVDRMHTLSHVKKTLEQKGVGRLVVKEKDFPVGIITATDVMFAELGDPVAGIRVRRKNIFRRAGTGTKERVEVTQPLAGDVMEADPITILAKENAVKAAQLMLDNNVSGLPVVDSNGLLAGIITKTDIVRAFLESEK